ncbi:hypothetical protein ACK32P_04265 [Aeromonas dhakensis]|uniref:hypothetical protein n=1 Tax=Aeromonas dhakensis TaxID=196024 RepID=UPI0039872635
MNIRKKAITLLTIGSLSACSGFPDYLATSTSIDWPWDSMPDNADIAFMDATQYCIKQQQYYAAGGGTAKTARFTLSALGTLAGAVFAPLATGSAAVAWSSFSGATNALQASYDQSFDYTLGLARRASIDQAMQNGKIKYEQANTDTKILAAINMASDCAMAPARIEQALVSRSITPSPSLLTTASGASPTLSSSAATPTK